MSGLFDDVPVIHSYSRADMLADGNLIDVTATAKEAGFKFPTAITRAAWEDCVAWTDADAERTGCYQDVEGRLWDVLYMAMHAAKACRGGDQIKVQLVRVDRHATPTEEGVEPTEVELIMIIGPGDTPEPVLTIMTEADR